MTVDYTGTGKPDREKKRPSIRLVVSAGLLILAGIGGFLFFLINGVNAISRNMHRLEAPGVLTATFEQTGSYTIFLESQGAPPEPARDASGLFINIADSQGEPIPVGPARGNSTYSINRLHGASIMGFELERPGRYRIEAGFTESEGDRRLRLAIGYGFLSQIFKMIFIGGGLLIAGVGGAVLVIIIGFFGTRNKKDRQDLGLPPPLE